MLWELVGQKGSGKKFSYQNTEAGGSPIDQISVFCVKMTQIMIYSLGKSLDIFLWRAMLRLGDSLILL